MAQLLFYFSARVHASRTQTGLSRGSSWPLYIMSANAVRHEVALGASSQLGWLTWLHSDWMVWLGSYQGGFTCHHQLGFWVLLPLSTWFQNLSWKDDQAVSLHIVWAGLLESEDFGWPDFLLFLSRGSNYLIVGIYKCSPWLITLFGGGLMQKRIK